MNIKRNEITELNVDDYIRQKKRMGQRRFFWSGEALKAFKYFSEATFADPMVGYPEEYFTIKNNEALPKPYWEHYPNGFTFMGVNHFKK